MKNFFSNLFGRKKESERKAPVVQVTLVAKKRVWRFNPVFKYLDHWNRPTFLTLTLDIRSGEYWSNLKAMVFAAMMTVSHAESMGCWDIQRERARVLEQHASKEVLLRVWPSAKFLDPFSAEFFDAVSFSAASGQPIEIFCKWKTD